MDERRHWLQRRFWAGSLLLAAGLVVFIGSLVAPAVSPDTGFDFRIVGGLGIGLGGAGLGLAFRYGMGLLDDDTARRVVVDELDERYVLMRHRAGARAYWASALLVFGGLMWTSFAANGKLAPLEGDALWYFLAAALLVPFGVYAGSLIVDQRRS
jgi:hypothetical protein